MAGIKLDLIVVVTPSAGGTKKHPARTIVQDQEPAPLRARTLFPRSRSRSVVR